MKRLLLVLLMLGLFAGSGFGQQSRSYSTGNIGAAGTTCSAGVCASLIMTVGTSVASIKITNLAGTGTFSATIQFEASLEGTDWYSISGVPIAGGASVSSATAAGLWRFSIGPFRWIRARCSAFTSGIPVVVIEASTAIVDFTWVNRIFSGGWAGGTGVINTAFINDANSDMWIKLRSGKTADYRAYFAWYDYAEVAHKWLLGRNDSNHFMVFDGLNTVHRLAVLGTTTNADTHIASAGSGAVKINGYETASGTGGAIIYAGGSGGYTTPLLQVDSTNGVKAYKAISIKPASGVGGLTINSSDASAQTNVMYLPDRGTDKWYIGKHSDNNFKIYNYATSHTVFTLGTSTDAATFYGTVDAGSYLTGSVNVISKASTPYTIETTATSESRRTVFTCTVSCVFTLPTAAVGKTITFATDSAGTHTITVARAGSDVIIDTTGSAYTQAALAATAGTSLSLLCIEANKWVVVGMTGSVTLT